MTTDWTRRTFTGTFRKFRGGGRHGREALISEIVDTSGKICIDWCWVYCAPELARICTEGNELAFTADCRHYPQGIEVASGRRIYFKLQRAGRALHMKARPKEVAQICATSEVDDWLHLEGAPIGAPSEVDDWLHLG